MFLSTQSVAQAYAVFQVVAAFLSMTTLSKSIVDPCQILHGHPCNDGEIVMHEYGAYWKVHVGVLLSTLLLSVSQDGTVPLLMKNSIIQTVLLEFAGVLMFGTKMLNGVMPDSVHLATCLVYFGFLVSFLLSSNGNEANAERNNGTHFFRWSYKGYLSLFAFYYAPWLFANNLEPCTANLVDESQFTLVTQMKWNWWSVGALETALLLWYTISYGSVKQQRLVVIALTAVQPLFLGMAFSLKSITTSRIFMMTTASFTLEMVLGVFILMTADVDGGSKKLKV